jgi:hypothetical protein
MLAGRTLPTLWVKTWARGFIAPWLTHVEMILDFSLIKLVSFSMFLTFTKFFYGYLPVENFVIP